MLTSSTRLQFKVENPDNDAILDSMAANAYAEQFALEVFGRAEAAMRADKVTKYVRSSPTRAGLRLTMAQTNSGHLSGCGNLP
jgi:vacuolar protein sorting-associated protein VTA1